MEPIAPAATEGRRGRWSQSRCTDLMMASAAALVMTVALSACNARPVTSTTTVTPPTLSSTRATSTTFLATTTTFDLVLGGPVLVDAPAVVANREPLPYCGAAFDDSRPNPYDEIEIVGGASECYRQRAEEGLTAELVVIGITVEGDPLMWIRRLMPDGREVVFVDATKDNFGAKAWLLIECEGYAGIPMGAGNCADSVVIQD